MTAKLKKSEWKIGTVRNLPVTGVLAAERGGRNAQKDGQHDPGGEAGDRKDVGMDCNNRWNEKKLKRLGGSQFYSRL